MYNVKYAPSHFLIMYIRVVHVHKCSGLLAHECTITDFVQNLDGACYEPVV